MRKWISVATMLLVSGIAATASAQTYTAAPWTFVGKVADCGVAGSKIATSSWQTGMGLPDNGTTPNPDGKDPHFGLLLSKNGPTANCSAAGATIQGYVTGTPLETLGFDYRVGGHCGAGAPRFNVTDTLGHSYFVGGCSAGVHSAAPQDPEWARVTFSAADFFPICTEFQCPPAFVPGTPVASIDIVYDEGTDQGSPSDPTGVGLAVLDNIRINSTVITQKKGNPIQP